MKRQFRGYRRPNGTFGARNFVFVLPPGLASSKICDFVPGTRTLVTADAGGGRTPRDRETFARVLIGQALNPNVAAVIIHNGEGQMLQPEFHPDRLMAEIAASGKPVVMIDGVKEGGTLGIIKRGIEVARELVYQASRIEREPVGLEHLMVGLKCGHSDPTSGLVGNPTVGYVWDRIVEAGGTALFGEATEIIGAEHTLTKRAVNADVAAAIVAAARFVEERALATGEDIVKSNPVPSNIESGITTLEEKSLGAVHKSGSMPIQGVLQYAERPKGKGLYFVHDWACEFSILQGHASAGAQVVLYQYGGGGLPAISVLDPWYGGVAPTLWCSGNPLTRRRCAGSLDFSSATVLEGEETVEQAGERLLDMILEVASGALTRSETIAYTPPTVVYQLDPVF